MPVLSFSIIILSPSKPITYQETSRPILLHIFSVVDNNSIVLSLVVNFIAATAPLLITPLHFC